MALSNIGGWLGLDNHALTATLSEYVGDEDPLFPLDRLQDPRLHRRWRTEQGDTLFTVGIDFGSSVSLDGVAMIGTNLTSSATMSVTISNNSNYRSPSYESGTLDAFDFSLGEPESRGWGRNAIHLFPSTQSGRYMLFNMIDGSNPLGYLESSIFVAGELTQPSRQFVSFDDEEQWIGVEGAEVATRRQSVRWTWMSESDRALIRATRLALGPTGRCLWIPRPASEATHAHEAIWCHMPKEPGSDAFGADYSGDVRWTIDAEMLEAAW